MTRKENKYEHDTWTELFLLFSPPIPEEGNEMTRFRVITNFH